MSLIHFKGPYWSKTACGRSEKMKSKTSERTSDVTCPKCNDVISRRREANKNSGNYTIKDDMVGTARITRSEGTKISVGDLRRIIRESLGNIEYMSRADAETYISSLTPDEVSDVDVVDEDTGEVYLEYGKAARTSMMHPDFVSRRAMEKTANDNDVEQDNVLSIKDEYRAALEEFVSQSEGIRVDADTAWDAADAFFWHNPDWEIWAKSLDMTKDEMQGAVAEFLYDRTNG